MTTVEDPYPFRVCPPCDGSGHSPGGSTPGGGMCPTCRGTGEVTATTHARLTQGAAT